MRAVLKALRSHVETRSRETIPAVRPSPKFISSTTTFYPDSQRCREMSLHATPPIHPFKKQRLVNNFEDDEEAAFNSRSAPVSQSASISKSLVGDPVQTSLIPQPPLPSAERLAKPLPLELVSSYDPANFPAELPKSISALNFRKGLFLAPMVRIGSLPTRLLSLEYGADLVWGPEIIDRAIMGSERVVDQRTGAVHFIKDGRAVFSTHHIERPHVIFQIGCATPAWAYEAVKLVTAHDDVAGVDLNCGCPKNFSTTGGMGAGLLPRPDLLCDILRAMRRAAPPHIAVTCKIRLLPTPEATRALVRQICRTGAIDAITIHCRTKEMRPREKALLDRISEVVDTVREETGGRMPVCHNGDSWNYEEAQAIMKASYVTSSMLARGPEKNPSCFRPGPSACAVDEIVPKWLKYALCFDNAICNTKYCLNTLDWQAARPATMRREELLAVKESVARAKTTEEMCQVDYYKKRIDMAKCKDEYETYVLGDLAAVLRGRRQRGEVAEQHGTAAAREPTQGAVERAEAASVAA